jgi:hypothetical protein
MKDFAHQRVLDAIGVKAQTAITFSEQIEFRQCAHDYLESRINPFHSK